MIVLAIVDELVLVEPPLRARVRCSRLWNIDVNAGHLAGGDFRTVKVALVGEHFDCVGVQRIARLLGHR